MSVCLFVGNLNKQTKKDEIKREFEKHGPIISVWLSSRTPRFAFVQYKNVKDASRVLTLNGHSLNGSPLRVELAHRPLQSKKNKDNVVCHRGTGDKVSDDVIDDASNVPLFWGTRDFYGGVQSKKNNDSVGRHRGPWDKVSHTPSNVPLFFGTRDFYNSNRSKNRNTGELNSSRKMKAS